MKIENFDYNNTEKNTFNLKTIPIRNFTRNEAMKYFDYEVYRGLKNVDYFHQDGFLVGDSQINLKKRNMNVL